ncbi:MAG: ABC transporter substrate-binding protein [Oscillospiraceae bacterium]
MKTHKHRISAALLSLALIAGILSSCGVKPTSAPDMAVSSAPKSASTAQTSEAQKPIKDGVQSFTDSLGRVIELPTDLQRVAPSGTLSQIVLYTLAPDRIVGWTSNPSKEMKKYFDEKYTSLPVFGTFYGKNADLNVEALIAANPQIVIDMGQIKGEKESMIKDLDELQKQIGIPVVFIDYYLETTGASYTKLGELLNMPSEAKKLADYCNVTIKDTKEKVAAIPNDKKVRVYYGEGETGLETNPAGSFHCEVLDMAGAVNVVEKSEVIGNNKQISMEQLIQWEPDTIILGPKSIYDTIGKDPLWKDLSAVKAKHYYEIPSGPYNFVDRPPAVNRIIGVKWLANLLYPEQFNYDMVKETKEFYSLFYHYELTDDEAKEILG